MKVSELAEKAGLQALCANSEQDKEIEGVYISDMVSDIITGAKANGSPGDPPDPQKPHRRSQPRGCGRHRHGPRQEARRRCHRPWPPRPAWDSSLPTWTPGRLRPSSIELGIQVTDRRNAERPAVSKHRPRSAHGVKATLTFVECLEKGPGSMPKDTVSRNVMRDLEPASRRTSSPFLQTNPGRRRVPVSAEPCSAR